MTSEQPPEGLLEVGRFGRPHGVRGQIYITLSTDRIERVQTGARLWAERWFEIRSSSLVPSRENNRYVVNLHGVEDRTAAEALVNRNVWAEPIDDEDAVWVHQVIDAEVIDAQGVRRGRCVSVIANPANDLLELESGALVPVIFVTSVTPQPKGGGFVVTIDPPDGLFELFADDETIDDETVGRETVDGDS